MQPIPEHPDVMEITACTEGMAVKAVSKYCGGGVLGVI